MDVREKLIELLDTNCGYVDEVKAEVLADYLISNGVTVQKYGHWEVANDGTHFCSNCGCDATYTWDDIERNYIYSADDVPDRITNYCPNCGAIMIYSSAKRSN